MAQKDQRLNYLNQSLIECNNAYQKVLKEDQFDDQQREEMQKLINENQLTINNLNEQIKQCQAFNQ